MLNYEFPPLGGGAANANDYLLQEFAADDIEIDLVTSSPDEYRVDKFSDTISIYRLNVGKDAVHHWTQGEIMRYAWKSYWKSRQLMNEREYDLIHAWFGVPCGVIARLFDLSYLVALRGSDVPGYNERFSIQYTFLKPIIQNVWENAHSVIANSQQLRDLAYETKEMDMGVIPNGVAVDEFEPAYPDRDQLRVLCVSRLVRRKGIRYLIEAMTDVEGHLTVVGEGQCEDELRSLVSRLNLEDCIEFKGYVPHEEIHQYYQNSDVFVLPSFNEGMSNTVLEAMAAGLPIITTDTGGTDELIDENGIVIPPRDSDAIAAALRSYDRETISRQGKRSHAIAEKMSWESVAKSYLEEYRKIIGS